MGESFLPPWIIAFKTAVDHPGIILWNYHDSASSLKLLLYELTCASHRSSRLSKSKTFWQTASSYCGRADCYSRNYSCYSAARQLFLFRLPVPYCTGHFNTCVCGKKRPGRSSPCEPFFPLS